MKKSRVVTIVTVSLALVLISSVTFAAAGRKRDSKPKAQMPEAVSEEEALKAELLAAMEENRKDVPGVLETKKQDKMPDSPNARSEES